MAVSSYTRERKLFRSAYNPSLDSTVGTIWPKNTPYVFPSAAIVMFLYSTSTADTTQLVLIEGLDASYAEISEVLTLNGQTGRVTTLAYLRINTMTVLTDSPVGNIALGIGAATAGVPATTYGFIFAGDNASASAVYTVPANWTFRLISGSLSVGGTTGSQVATIAFYSNVNGVRYLTSKIGSANGFQFFPYNPALDVPEKTDIYANGTMSSGAALVTATFNGLLLKNIL
jgi:hypothetical protein